MRFLRELFLEDDPVDVYINPLGVLMNISIHPTGKSSRSAMRFLRMHALHLTQLTNLTVFVITSLLQLLSIPLLESAPLESTKRNQTTSCGFNKNQF